jgi:uncharacterized protein YndB with AHSA1/START domain
VAQLSHVLDVGRKPEEVFELLGDPTRDAEWAGPVVAVVALMPGPIGIGSRYRQMSRTLGIRFPMLLEVIEYEPNRRIALKSVAGAVAFRNERRFDPIDTGTRVTFIGNVRLPRVLRFVEPLAVRFSGGQVDRDLDAVKPRLESQRGKATSAQPSSQPGQSSP